MSNVKILITYKNKHKLLQSRIIHPIQTGRAISEFEFDGMIGDNTGDNISIKNKNYSEISAQYWAWKNYKQLGNPNYIGFMHYRRHFIFNVKEYDSDELGCVRFKRITAEYLNDVSLNDDDIEEYIGNNDVLIGKKIDLRKVGGMKGTKFTPREAFSANPDLWVKDYDLMITTTKELYPDYSTVIDKVEKGYYQHWYNMFVMRKEIFFRYNEFLFKILFDLEKKIDTSMYGSNAQRIFGYLSERLLTIFIEKLRDEHLYKIKETHISFIENTKENNRLEPIFKSNYVTVAFSCSDYYVPYLAVCLSSITLNSNREHNYDIIIFNRDISDNNQKKLKSLVDRSNISLRFLSLPDELITSHLKEDLTKGAHFSIETYFRIFLPQFLSAYNKFVYLDADILVLNDIFLLNDIDLEGNTIAACIDSNMAGNYNIDYHGVRSYFKNVLLLESPYKYFQAGVMIFDAEKFRNNDCQNQLIDLIGKIKTKCADQCIFNAFFKTRIKHLDLHWNCQTEYAELKSLKLNLAIPEPIYKEYQKARKNPSIIHYAGYVKPWFFVDEDMSDTWWEHAKKTPFYHILLDRLMEFKSKNQLQGVTNYTKIKRLYLKYKILSMITFGKKREHYNNKKNIFKQKRNAIRDFLTY